ncbi:histidine-phosphotransfer domain, HPT domain-containing protein [Metschnikowia bicuspidata]|uniref:Histidine-phosphotransfer domain, HPT domain-containing protein n=1 Tax=Metschnikowia bicuspidata TaxID=27322 RepID=A0A4P9ZGX6_9ASCO|nr:histidine-phosphotransfer domain, HPT domain-containing protein [Metschnikowia bicuspidata]
MCDDKKKKLQESGLVDWPVFSELVAMDEDEEGFSRGLFQTFVDQFEDTYRKFKENVDKTNLDGLSALGHYLKGSAAALGLVTIAEQCERIQNYGHRNNCDEFLIEGADATHGDTYWISLVEDAMAKAQQSFNESNNALNAFFGETDASDEKD